MATNPVKMSVLPTEQCLIDDGTNAFFVAGQFTPPLSFGDSYELCDPNSKCGVVVGAVGAFPIATLLLQLPQLVAEGKNREAADVSAELGLRFKGLQRPTEAMTSYRHAATLYRDAGDLVNAADALSSAAREAALAGINAAAFDYAGLAVNVYFDAAQTKITKAEKLSCYRKAYESLQVQVEVVRANRESGTPSNSTYKVEVSLCERQIEAIKGVVAGFNPIPTDDLTIIIEQRTVRVELARAHEHLADAYVVLGKLDEAVTAYLEQYALLINARPYSYGLDEAALVEEILVEIKRFEGRFNATAGMNNFRMIRSVLERETQKGRLMSAIAQLVRDGDRERLKAAASEFARLFDGREGEAMRMLDNQESWLNEALRDHFGEEFVGSFHRFVGKAVRAKMTPLK